MKFNRNGFETSENTTYKTSWHIEERQTTIEKEEDKRKNRKMEIVHHPHKKNVIPCDGCIFYNALLTETDAKNIKILIFFLYYFYNECAFYLLFCFPQVLSISRFTAPSTYNGLWRNAMQKGKKMKHFQWFLWCEKDKFRKA